MNCPKPEMELSATETASGSFAALSATSWSIPLKVLRATVAKNKTPAMDNNATTNRAKSTGRRTRRENAPSSMTMVCSVGCATGESWQVVQSCMKSLRQTTLNVSTHGYFHPVNETASSTVDSAGFVAPPSVVPLPRGRVTLHLREIEAGESAHFVPSPAQQLVIDHTSGAMLVLAGPGTGKTFTLTQAVTERITRDGFEPSEILVLTFARKAADEIRERIALAAPSGSLPHVATFHSLALALVTEFGNSDVSQPTLWSAPQQELSVRELLRSIADEPAVARSFGWPESLREALTTRGLAIEIRNALGRAQSLGMSASKLASVTAHSLEWSAVAKVYEEYLETLDQQLSLDYNELISTAL